jgi:hypothetical protein
MSACSRCGATFSCAMADGGDPAQPCWCTALPAAVPLPAGEGAMAAGCWCPACLRLHIDELRRKRSDTPAA